MAALGLASPSPELPLTAVQQIRIAVLENELKHERTNREVALSTNHQITSILTSILISAAKSNYKPIIPTRVRGRSSSLTTRLVREKVLLKRQVRACEKENQKLRGLRTARIKTAENLIDKYGQTGLANVPEKGDCSGNNSFTSFNEGDFDPGSETFHAGSEEVVLDYSSVSSGTTPELITPVYQPIEISEELSKIDFLTLDDVLRSPADRKHQRRANLFASGDAKKLEIAPPDDDLRENENKEQAEEIFPLVDVLEEPNQYGIDLEARYSTPHTEITPTIRKVGIDIQKSFGGTGYSLVPNTKDDTRHGTARPHSSASNGLQRPIDLALFNSAEVREAMIEQHKRYAGMGNLFPDFFRYGLSYAPWRNEPANLRTVHIGNLPIGTSLKDMAARIRGGEVISIILANTIDIMGCLSALVQFQNEGSASDYVEFVKTNKISIDDNTLLVTLLTSPTWPLSIPARKRIYGHGQTRCLCIRNFPAAIPRENLLRDLSSGNGYRAASIEDIYMDHEGHLHLSFASIQMAGMAYGILTRYGTYAGLVTMFERDPCGGELEEMLQPIGEKGVSSTGVNSDEISLDSDDDPMPVIPSLSQLQPQQYVRISMHCSHNADLLQQQREINSAAVAELSSVKSKATPQATITEPSFIPTPQSQAPTHAVTSLSNIPSAGKHTSWADEVIEAAESPDSNPPTSASEQEFPFPPAPSRPFRPVATRNPPLDLASSKYATPVPGLAETRFRPRTRSHLRRCFTADIDHDGHETVDDEESAREHKPVYENTADEKGHISVCASLGPEKRRSTICTDR